MPIHPDKARRLRLARERTRKTRERVIAKYGGRCQCPGCGISRYEWLVIDHVNGGGNRERAKRTYNKSFLAYLDKRPRLARYQLLCHNCNAAKAYFEACPHREMANQIPLVIIDGQIFAARLYQAQPLIKVNQ